ncbi:MAG: hypothetical protein ISS23_03460 [Nanoarchaeota archaeon]|nr:hypothetical protein [Nanoarchaeota archaeon]
MGNQIKDFIITILVVTFVFAFDDKQSSFELGYWLTNFFRVAVGVTLVVLMHYTGHKWAARRYGVDVTHKVWSIRRYGLAKKAHFPIRIDFLNITVVPIKSFPLGAVLAVIISFLSNGRFFFTPVEAIDIKSKEYKRMGRWRLKVLERETARIAFAGPVANILFAFVLQSFNKSGMFDQVILISCLYALYHMIPWSQLDGAKIFFGSMHLYVFGLAFILLSFLMLMLLPVSAAFFLSILGAAVILVFFFLRMHLGK